MPEPAYRLTPIEGVEGLAWVAQLTITDARGWLTQRYSRDAFLALGLPESIHEIGSWPEFAGVVRGLHFQVPPMSQAKLFCVREG